MYNEIKKFQSERVRFWHPRGIVTQTSLKDDDIDLFDSLTSLYFPVVRDYETLLWRIFWQVKQVSISIVTGQKEILTASVTSVMTYMYSSKLQFCLFTRSPRAGFPRLIKVAKDFEYAKSNYNSVTFQYRREAMRQI